MIDCSPRRIEACMARRTLGVAALLLVPALAWPRQGPAQTFKTAKFSIGGAVALDAKTGDIVGTAQLEDNSPEGAASDGKGKIFINNEGTSTMQVLDVKTMKVLASWPLAPCEGPTGIAYDRATNRIFSGCGKTSVVVDPVTGKIVATIANGDGVDALGCDPAEKLVYIPAGRDSNVTVVHEDAPDKYTVVATVTTMRGAKTISVD